MNTVIGFPIILISWIVIYTVDGIIQCSNNTGPEPGGGGGGGETRSGTEKRCSYNLQGSHLALRSVDNNIAVFSQSKYFRSEPAEEIIQKLK